MAQSHKALGASSDAKPHAQSVRSAGIPFPLTLALSLAERENCIRLATNRNPWASHQRGRILMEVIEFV